MNESQITAKATTKLPAIKSNSAKDTRNMSSQQNDLTKPKLVKPLQLNSNSQSNINNNYMDGASRARQPSKANQNVPPPVSIQKLDAELLPNLKLNKVRQDTYARTHSIARESWQINYKECMRHQRLVKDNNLEKTCDSCNTLYVLCEACRNEREVPFGNGEVCIDCAPSAHKVRGLIDKRDALIRELHYKTQKIEDVHTKSLRGLENAKQQIADSDELRQQMQEDYRKSVADCIQRDNENVELAQKLAESTKEISQLQVASNTQKELVEDYMKMLRSGAYADCEVVLTQCGVRFPLHKNILAARSEYFRGLIEGQHTSQPVPQNNKRQSVQTQTLIGYNLDGVDKETAQEVFEFIYCGRCNNIVDEKSAVSLYDIASRLGMPSLQDVIITHFITKLSRENWTEIAAATLIIQSNSKKFKDYLRDFIINECTDLIDINSVDRNSEWSRLKEKNPGFAVEILESRMKKDERRNRLNPRNGTDAENNNEATPLPSNNLTARTNANANSKIDSTPRAKK